MCAAASLRESRLPVRAAATVRRRGAVALHHGREDRQDVTEAERSDARTEFGADFRGGIAFLFTPNFGIFVEGRYTFFQTNPGGQNTEFDIETFHALAGLSFRF